MKSRSSVRGAQAVILVAILVFAVAAGLACRHTKPSGPEVPTTPPPTTEEATDASPTPDELPAKTHGVCEDAQPLRGSGFFECADGRVHRPEVVECPSSIVDDSGAEADPGPGNPDDQCTRNADCTEKPNGYCAAEGQLPDRMCHYGCTVDAECGDGALCMCDVPVGRCVSAACQDSGACGEGLLCTRYYAADDLDWGAFACDTANDECNNDDDCLGEGRPESICIHADGARKCVPGVRAVY